jgi:hypothetical protein
VRARSLLLALVGAFVGAGCSTTPAVTLQSVGQSPAGSLSPGLASVPVGIVLGFRVTANSATVVTAAIDDPSLATVAPTTQASEFVIIGLATGQTTLHVFVDNGEVTELPVQVTTSAR